eukprot:2717249-Amphidinium_carterae.1
MQILSELVTQMGQLRPERKEAWELMGRECLEVFTVPTVQQAPQSIQGVPPPPPAAPALSDGTLLPQSGGSHTGSKGSQAKGEKGVGTGKGAADDTMGLPATLVDEPLERSRSGPRRVAPEDDAARGGRGRSLGGAAIEQQVGLAASHVSPSQQWGAAGCLINSRTSRKKGVWQVLTCNATVWASWQVQWDALLEAHREHAVPLPDMVCVQEHHLPRDRIAGAMQRMATCSLRVCLDHGLAGQQGHVRAGTGIGARPWIGRQQIHEIPPLLAGRLTVVKLDAILKGGITLLSLYATTAVSDEVALDEMAALIEVIRSIEGAWLVGGDWQQQPQTIERWGVPAAVGGELVQPGCPTCSTGRCLDYFLVCTTLMQLCEGASLLDLVTTRPHSGVVLTIRSPVADDVVNLRRRKHGFPERCPVGPCRYIGVPSWTVDEENLSGAWQEWSRQAELHLCGVFDLEPSPGWVGRGAGVSIRQVSVSKMAKIARPPRTLPTAIAWRRLLCICER